jgi:hypothetical protein
LQEENLELVLYRLLRSELCRTTKPGGSIWIRHQIAFIQIKKTLVLVAVATDKLIRATDRFLRQDKVLWQSALPAGRPGGNHQLRTERPVHIWLSGPAASITW